MSFQSPIQQPNHFTRGALGASQLELEQLYSKYQLIPTIERFFIEDGADDQLAAMDIPVSFGLRLMAQAYLHRRAPVAVFVGMLMHYFEEAEAPAQACADMIALAAEKDVIDLMVGEDAFGDPTLDVIGVWGLDRATERKLDMYQFPLPMIEPPRHITHNRQTGYETIKGSVILKQNHHSNDVVLEHLNRVNSVPLALDANIVAFVQNRWKHVDKPKPGEDAESFQKRRKAYEKYNRVSKDVLTALMAQGDRFWLTHRYDKRGRTYCQGYHVTYQGNDWNKACVVFADAEKLNEE